MAKLRTSLEVADAAALHQTEKSRSAAWVAPEVVAGLDGVVLIPAVAPLLAARSPFFRALLSGRWWSANGMDKAESAEVLAMAPTDGSAQLGSPETVCLPVVRLASDAEAVLQLLNWMAMGRMEPYSPESGAHNIASARCARCRQLQTAVTAASLAGEWLMDSAQEAAETLVMRSPLSDSCCRRSVVEAAYEAHLEGLAHRLSKRFWAEADAARSAESWS